MTTTPLCLAINRIDNDEILEKVVNLLVEHGADVNKLGKGGTYGRCLSTPLAFASNMGKIRTVRTLIENGCDVNLTRPGHNTPLMVSKSLEIVNILLQSGANVNSRNILDYTALHFSRDERVVRALISAGADPNAIDEEGLSPLFKNCEQSHLPSLREIIKGGGILDIVYPCKYTPLTYAIQYGKMDIVKLFIEMGADVNMRDSHGKTPLETSNYNMIEITQLLLEAGANPNIKGRYGNPAWIPIKSREYFDLYDKYVHFGENNRQFLLSEIAKYQAKKRR